MRLLSLPLLWCAFVLLQGSVAAPGAEWLDAASRITATGLLLFIWWKQWQAMREDQQTYREQHQDALKHADQRHQQSVEVATELHSKALARIDSQVSLSHDRHQATMDRVLGALSEQSKTNRALTGALSRLEKQIDTSSNE